MHASRGMDEKWLIICPKMNEIVSLALTLFPTYHMWLLLVASHFSWGFSFFGDFSASASSFQTCMSTSTTASSLHLRIFVNIHTTSHFFVRLECLLTSSSKIRHKVECFVTGLFGDVEILLISIRF